MALSRTTNRQTFTAVTGDTQFTFDFAFFDRSSIDEANYKYGDIKLTRESTTGVLTPFIPKTDFTIPPTDGEFRLTATNNDPEQGGTVTISVAATGGEKFTVERDVAYTQQYDLQEGSTIDPTALNKAFDRVVAQNQQQEATLSNTVQFPVTDSPSTTYTVGSEVTRANKALGFDASGNVTEIDLVDAGAISGDTNAGISISNNIISAKVDNSTTQFSGGNIVVNKIDTVNLKDNAVTQAKIDDNAVTNAAIANNAVDTDQIDDEAVTFAKMQKINANRVIGRTTGSGTDHPVEIFIDHTLDTVSSGHDTVASAKAIKAYVDQLRPKYIPLTGGTRALSQSATTAEYTHTWDIADFTGTGLVPANITALVIDAKAGGNGYARLRATLPDGTLTTIARGDGSSGNYVDQTHTLVTIPINAGQTSFSIEGAASGGTATTFYTVYAAIVYK